MNKGGRWKTKSFFSWVILKGLCACSGGSRPSGGGGGGGWGWGSGGKPDPEIGGTRSQLGPFGPQFDLKIRRAQPPSPRGNSEMAYYLVPLPIIIV